MHNGHNKGVRVQASSASGGKGHGLMATTASYYLLLGWKSSPKRGQQLWEVKYKKVKNTEDKLRNLTSTECRSIAPSPLPAGFFYRPIVISSYALAFSHCARYLWGISVTSQGPYTHFTNVHFTLCQSTCLPIWSSDLWLTIRASSCSSSIDCHRSSQGSNHRSCLRPVSSASLGTQASSLDVYPSSIGDFAPFPEARSSPIFSSQGLSSSLPRPNHAPSCIDAWPSTEDHWTFSLASVSTMKPPSRRQTRYPLFSSDPKWREGVSWEIFTLTPSSLASRHRPHAFLGGGLCSRLGRIYYQIWFLRIWNELNKPAKGSSGTFREIASLL
jgi:hypothetical protein